MNYDITDNEFRYLSKLLYNIAGIELPDAKKVLLTGRLAKRLNALGMQTYTQYIKYIGDAKHADELQYMVDLLTTNETYFFRESEHFDFLRQEILPKVRRDQTFHIWSAAASIGAEAYTIAMVLAETLGVNGLWEIFGSDISTLVLEKAVKGHYRMAEAAKIPPEYLKKYCLKGTGPQEGTFLIDRKLRSHVHFAQLNLIEDGMKKPGEFDVIFLRNVLIYFDIPTKRRVIKNLVPCLKKGGYLIIGHAESLNGVTDVLPQLKPTIYRKPL